VEGKFEKVIPQSFILIEIIVSCTWNICSKNSTCLKIEIDYSYYKFVAYLVYIKYLKGNEYIYRVSGRENTELTSQSRKVGLLNERKVDLSPFLFWDTDAEIK
jgi:hypothetical protein